MSQEEHLRDQSRVLNLVVRCAVIAAVVALGVSTVRVAGAIALGAGASVAVFFADATTIRLGHRTR